MSAAWLTYPLQLEGSRAFDCDPLTTQECDYYKQRWHFWYIADHVFALPTVAFFMCTIGIFIFGYVVSSLVFGHSRSRWVRRLDKPIAAVRYLSYRGFHIRRFRWNSAPVGVLILGVAGTVFFFCMDLIPQPYYWSDEMYGHSPPLATRSGWLSLACMPFVFATASKTNWITLVTGVSHERLQVFHRWIAYAFFVLALMHTFPFIVYHIHWHDMREQFSSSLLSYWTGIVAVLFQAWLTFASHGVIRNLGYEFFKVTHFSAAVVFVVTFFWHCDYSLTSWDYFVATAAVYVPCYVYSWVRTFSKHGFSQKAKLRVEENGFTRITVPTKAGWKPGQHCFLRFTSFGIMQAMSTHPFTICSTPSTEPKEQSELVFYIRHQRGFTAKLYQHALERPDISVPVLVDGPYGGISLQKYYASDQILVIAGGSGAGWCLPFIELFARQRLSSADEESGRASGSTEDDLRHSKRSGPVSLEVILATRDSSSRTWFLRTIDEVLSKCSATASSLNIRFKVHLTGEAAQETAVPSNVSADMNSSKQNAITSDKTALPENGSQFAPPAKEFEGRPDLPRIVHDEATRAAEANHSLSVFVCGPDTMQNDVRNAVARENLGLLKGSKTRAVYLHTEHFSWA